MSHIQELEDCIKKEFEVSYDIHTCPDGFEANDEHRALYARVPDKDRHLILPKWVHYLNDGRIAAYAIGAPINAMPYIIDIFAEPSLNDDDEPFELMPHWYCAAMHANEGHWQVLYKETYKIAPWGIATDLKRHRDLTKVVDSLISRIEFMQRDLEGACQAADLCEYRLQVAQAHKFVNHGQSQDLVHSAKHSSSPHSLQERQGQGQSRLVVVD